MGSDYKTIISKSKYLVKVKIYSKFNAWKMYNKFIYITWGGDASQLFQWILNSEHTLKKEKSTGGNVI